LLHFCVKITRDVIDPAKNSKLRDVATAATIIDVGLVLNIILIFYGSCFNFSLRRNFAEKVFGWLTNFTNSAGIRLSYKITAAQGSIPIFPCGIVKGPNGCLPATEFFCDFW